MTLRTDIGYIKVSKRDEFVNSWKKRTTWQASPNNPHDAASGSGGGGGRGGGGGSGPDKPGQAAGGQGQTGGAEATEPAVGKLAKQAAKAKAKARVKTPEEAPPAKKKKGSQPTSPAAATEFKVHLALATKTKKAYHDAIAGAMSLLEIIDTSPSWSDQKGRTGELEEAVVELKQSIVPFTQSFMCMDTQQLKQQYTADALSIGVQQIPHIDPLIKAVTQSMNKVHSMHAVDLSYR